jgi:hypothetical protein
MFGEVTSSEGNIELSTTLWIITSYSNIFFFDKEGIQDERSLLIPALKNVKQGQKKDYADT